MVASCDPVTIYKSEYLLLICLQGIQGLPLNNAFSSCRFRESDQLPGNVRQKLQALPAVMLTLETSQASGKGL